MNTYSRVLRHISMEDVKLKHQQKLIEKKILEEKKKEEEEYIASVMEEKKYVWRKELNEQMTTSDMFFNTLPATGDVNLAYPSWNALGGYNYNISGGTATITNSGVEGPESGIAASFDTSLYDTLVIDVGFSGDTILGVFYSGSADPLLITTNSGTYNIKVPQSKNQDLVFLSATLSVGTVNISNLRFQRRTPMNVFVSLDSPEATSFIRTDPMMANLSPQERLKKLKDMFEASDEYVMKMLGLDFPGTGAVTPGEYDPFKQAPPGEAGDTPGVEISQLYPADYDMERNTDTMLLKGLQRGDYGTGPAIDKQIQNIMKNMQRGTPGGLPKAQASQDTQIASEPLRGQRTDVRYDPNMKMFVPRPSNTDSGTNVQDLIKQASLKKTAMVASYEPEGQVLSEKKLKSPEEILNKIPGYYDGKPAPLGFPVEPPPKMVNGMHPDLVDGKKVADRFNRLDPESAKAMPPTGNPHIDKKVRASAKKPK